MRTLKMMMTALLLATCGQAAGQDNNQIVDITKNFTYCWGPSERMTLNTDGSITYRASTWGGLAYWVSGNWEAYERLVFELKEETTCAVQPIVMYGAGSESHYTNRGVTEAYIDLNPNLRGNVQQVALQTDAAATLTIKRIYLVMEEKSTEDEPEDTFPDGEGGRLLINELMQSNIDCTMDDLKEFPDSWVELYNHGTAAVNTGNYRIGISRNADEAYRLPGKAVEPGGHRIVYCDKENDKFHTDFRLETGKGCEVYLFKDGEIVDSVTGLGKQPAPNISYGRETDGSDTWGYQLTATPREANAGGITDEKHTLGDPLFSEQGRVMTGKAALTLTLSTPKGSPDGTEIRYTTDGTEPTQESQLYTSPITISTSVSIRAKLFADGWLSPTSATQSYIFFPRNLTLPVVSITTDNDYLNGGRYGILTNNSNENRHNWRRPINFEYFDREEAAARLNQLCETRVAGAASRGAQLKSLALYANKRFGTKRFDYEFFPDQKPGLTDFKSIVLRNAGNDFDYLYMRDAICQRVMAEHVDLDWQAWRPAIIYINGQYKGMLNIRERANENNIYTNYNGLEDIDLIENWWDLKEGKWDHYNDFKAFYTEDGHTMEEYEEWMDCQEFINLMVMNLYFNNYDFPGNNIIMWRPRAEGGRWRWVAKDVDYTMGLYGDPYNYRILNWIYNPSYDRNHSWGANNEEYTLLFRQLMKDEDFSRELIDHCAVFMGDFLNLEGIRKTWDPMYDEIKTEYPNHRRLINQWWPNYNDELNNARNWLRQRTNFFYSHLGEYYHLGTPIPLTVDLGKAMDERPDIDFNGIRLSEGVFNGKFYPTRLITLKGTDDSDIKVKGWEVTVTNGSSSTTQEYSGNTLSIEMPQCTGLAISAITDRDPAGINSITTSEIPQTVYDLRGRIVRRGNTSLEGLPRGVYIVGGKKVVRSEE